MHAINLLPENIYPLINNHAMRITCYTAEIACRVYFNDAKHLVYAEVLHKIEPVFEGDDRHVYCVAKKRQ